MTIRPRGATKDSVLKAYISGITSSRAIAAHLDLSPPYVRATLSRNGLKCTRGRSEKQRARDMENLLRRAHDALSRPAENAMLESDWDQLIADIAEELK